MRANSHAGTEPDYPVRLFLFDNVGDEQIIQDQIEKGKHEGALEKAYYALRD